MRTLSKSLSAARQLPLGVIMRKINRRMRTALSSRSRRWVDSRRSSYLDLSLGTGELARLLKSAPTAGLTPSALAAIEHYLDHRFDILGSGWTQVCHGMVCRGLEGYRHEAGPKVVPDPDGVWLAGRINAANQAMAQSIWRLIEPPYRPIDWHLDFKSGYRWREDCWYRDIRFGGQGVDVKVPWELARMQHLPQLALAYAAAPASPERARYCREFRNQILDFVATNPPRFGVNWSCAMEVAIRIANWLIAYDIFRFAGADFDAGFGRLLQRSIMEHAQHITDNLEWFEGVRGNHYLADIVGLLFAAAYLPPSSRTDAWLAFAVSELLGETRAQFLPDGSNFEASTAYHRLSSELVVYGTALTLALEPERRKAFLAYDHRVIRGTPSLPPAPLRLYSRETGGAPSPIPAEHLQRLERMAEFVMDITSPGGEIVQFGDNDSGRLFKLQPSYQIMSVTEARDRYTNLDGYVELPDTAPYPVESHLDHRHLVAAIDAFASRTDFATFAASQNVDRALLRSLVPDIEVYRRKLDAPRWPARGLVIVSDREPSASANAQCYRFAPAGTLGSLRRGLSSFAYPDFGVFGYRSDRLFLAIRCGHIGMNGLGPHAHNDALGIELWLDSEPVIRDPGTYLYTALPARRNQFRSVNAHFAPRLAGHEPGRLDLDIFALGDEARPMCVRFDDRGFVGQYSVPDGYVFRQITIADAAVEVVDWSDVAAAPLVRLGIHDLEFSPGYGWLRRVPG